jgi:hypothetical protein
MRLKKATISRKKSPTTQSPSHDSAKAERASEQMANCFVILKPSVQQLEIGNDKECSHRRPSIPEAFLPSQKKSRNFISFIVSASNKEWITI